jgi:hypothetical protein
MRITLNHLLGQLFLAGFILTICACTGRREEVLVVPTVTSPLSRDYIGYGVITASYTHVTSDPADNSPSIGYLRRGSFVRILRRQSIKTPSGFQSWVLIDGDNYGWLMENVMDIYDNEDQARTASESIHR